MTTEASSHGFFLPDDPQQYGGGLHTLLAFCTELLPRFLLQMSSIFGICDRKLVILGMPCHSTLNCGDVKVYILF
jgi:hypothetical protein